MRYIPAVLHLIIFLSPISVKQLSIIRANPPGTVKKRMIIAYLVMRIEKRKMRSNSDVRVSGEITYASNPL